MVCVSSWLEYSLDAETCNNDFFPLKYPPFIIFFKHNLWCKDAEMQNLNVFHIYTTKIYYLKRLLRKVKLIIAFNLQNLEERDKKSLSAKELLHREQR